MTKEKDTKRFLDVFYRSDMLLGDENTNPQKKNPEDEIKNYRHRSQQYLAVLHHMNGITEKLNTNGELPPSELNTLMTIGNFDHRPRGIRSAELSSELKVSTAATSKTLKILETKGLINRLIDEKDRRGIYITLTEAGQNIYQKTASAQGDLMERVFQRMGEKDMNFYLTLWEKFNKIVEQEGSVTTDVVKIRRDSMKTVFIEDCNFSFTHQDILERMGMPRNHKFGDSIKKLIDIARPIAKPKAFYMEVEIEKRTGKTLTIAGETFTSTALVKNLAKVNTVYPYLCTCGEELAAYAKTLDDIMEQYAFDAIMEFYRKRINVDMTAALANALESGGQISAVNPGSLVDWPIYQQKPLFNIFGQNADKIGVDLSENYLMFPIKSVSGIFYAADEEFHNCQLCQRKNCPSREAPFSEKLYMETLHD
ncbi:MAG: MarR family transcriptional regulator [Clostridiales bacterium]